MVYITRKEHFSSSHKLFNPNLTAEKNKAIFDKCYNTHGHNYYLEVTLVGEPSPESGYVMDFKGMKSIIHKEIINKVDHTHLNDLEMFKDKILTAEIMVEIFWNILENKLRRENSRLYSLRLYETDNNYVEYKGSAS